MKDERERTRQDVTGERVELRGLPSTKHRLAARDW
jgi:hypothetical protein